MGKATLAGFALTTVCLVHCAAEPPKDEGTALQQAASCTADWKPTWSQGSGANEWWVEYAIGGADVSYAYLELSDGGQVNLTKAYGKWVGKPSVKIPRGAPVVIHAVTTDYKSAQTKAFAYLDVATPTSDPCTGSGATCDNAFRPSFRQESGSNEWWLEFAIDAGIPVTRAWVEYPNGGTLALTKEFGKWRGKPAIQTTRNTKLVLHAAGGGYEAQSSPFSYLSTTEPALAPCGTPPSEGTCSPLLTPTWTEGSGANEWWVEYAITGAIASARLDLLDGGSIPLTYGAGKWRGKPSTRLASGTSVRLHAQTSGGAAADTEPFAYLQNKAPKTQPCASSGGTVTFRDVGGPETGPDTFSSGTVIYDAANDKTLLLGSDSNRAALRRCNGDGTGCTAHYLDANAGFYSGTAGNAILDPDHQKLLFSTWVDSSSRALSVFRCDTNGSNCARNDIAAFQGGGPGTSLAIDHVNTKLLIAGCTPDGARLARCELDGTGCSVTSIRPGDYRVCDSYQSGFALDEAQQKLLFTALDDTDGTRRLALTRCSLQGTGCTVSYLPAPPSFDAVSAAFDPVTRKLAVAIPENNAEGGPLKVVSAEADGSGATLRDLGYAGYGASAHMIRGELVISTSGPFGTAPTLFRCTPTAEGCTRKDLTADRGFVSGSSGVAYDSTRDTFLVGVTLGRDDGTPPFEIAPLLMRQPRAGGAHVQVDVSAGPGESVFANGSYGAKQSAYVDEANRKLLTLGRTTNNGFTPSRRIRAPLTRCNLDGTACTVVETGNAERILGVTGGKLYMLGIFRSDPRNQDNTSKVELLRCNVDGTGCTRASVRSPLAEYEVPVAALDAARGVAVIAIENELSNVDPLLIRCPLDGSACAAPVTLPKFEVRTMSVVRDQLVFTNNFGHVLRCLPNGTGCNESIVDPAESEGEYEVHSDSTGLVIVWVGGRRNDSTWGAAAVITCRIDGTLCQRRALGIGVDPSIHSWASTLDGVSDRLFLEINDYARLNKPTLFECARDGSGCTATDISAGQPGNSAWYPTVLIDHVENRIDVVGMDRNRMSRASLFSLKR